MCAGVTVVSRSCCLFFMPMPGEMEMFGNEFAKGFAVVALGVAVCAGFNAGSARAQAAPDYAALLAAPDRSDADREADKRRDPVPFLKFAGPAPGMKVLDMGAGG